MKNLAVLIDKPGFTQKFKRLAEELNKLSNNINVTLFCAERGPIPVKMHFPIMELVTCYNFDGTMLSTDLYTTQIMRNCLRPQRKLFYVYDLEYLYSPFTFSFLNSVYNSDVELIARNQTRYNILKNTWKEPAGILEEFNYEQLQRFL